MGVCCCISLCRRKIHSMVATPATVKVTIILLFFFFRIRFKQSCKVDSCVYESIRFYSPAVSYYRLNRISISIVSIRYSFQFHEKKNKILNESKGKLINLTLFFFFVFYVCGVYSLFARAFLPDTGYSSPPSIGKERTPRESSEASNFVPIKIKISLNS